MKPESTPQTELLSAFLDDELSDREAKLLAAQLVSDRALTRTFRSYAVVGDVLRSVQPVYTGQSLAESVAEALSREPVYLSPAHLHRRERRAIRIQEGRGQQKRAAWAASVAAVAFLGVVGWAIGTSDGQIQVQAGLPTSPADLEEDARQISFADPATLRLVQAHRGGAMLLRPVVLEDSNP